MLKPFAAPETQRGRVTVPSRERKASERRERKALDFDAVYQEHTQNVARWVARLGGPGVDVEDITQEVFLVVDRRLHEFRHDSSLATWLFSITAKLVANDRRRRKVRRWWLRLTPNAGSSAVYEGETALEQIETRERRGQFYEALEALSERQRRVLVLFELEDMSIADIAALTGLRAGNVRVVLHRARAAFFKRMSARELHDALAPRRDEPEGRR
jgi:RNA polymerase sigma-70 factor (ECF subfamily)